MENQFIGKGAVKGMVFSLLQETSNGFLYSVEDEGRVHYEVFKRVERPKLLDWDTKEISEEKYPVYPRTEDFGKWAWSYSSLEKAVSRLQSF